MNSVSTELSEAHPRKAKKPLRYHTLAELLRHAYTAKRGRIALTAAECRTLAEPDGLRSLQEQRGELLPLAASDRTLERSRELLLLTEERLRHQPSASHMRAFVRDVLNAHPIFQSPMLRGVLENLPDAPTVESAVEALATQPLSALAWPVDTASLKMKELERLRTAAIHCLVFLVRDDRSLLPRQVQRLLYLGCWKPAMQRHEGTLGSSRILALARDPAALAEVFSTLEDEAAKSGREAFEARAAVGRLRSRIEELQRELGEKQSALEEAKGDARDLRQQIEQGERAHGDAMAHARDHYERLRGRVMHRLQQDADLLAEGLVALRREPPKVHVMDDHADRVVDQLRAEIEDIRGMNK